ncbi:MAG: 2-phosphosulfolactate phosphatase [Candidatus Bathyarchaeia archaeon]|nr:2-phosphosulfolactate phosphatase [Candidatus Bathyarchaeota archaeon]
MVYASVLLGMDMVKRELRSGDVAVVIDVIRASTTIITALKMGAESVIPASSIREALQLRETHGDVILSGERGGVKIKGFHLDNSPFEVSSTDMRGKKLVITTTHGTQLIKAAMGRTDKVLVGSLINRAACSRLAYELAEEDGGDVKVVIPRSTIGICIEDLYAAGLIVESIKGQGSSCSGDLTGIASILASVNVNEMRRVIKESTSATIVKGVGHEDDVDYCLRLDEIDLIPISRGFELKATTL